jgi:hypothetical protein
MKAATNRWPAVLRWTKTSYLLLSLFLVTIGLILAVWWPLARDYLASIDPNRPIWAQLDWLLIGDFLVMSILIMCGADLRRDLWIAAVALAGGLVIEAWGTQTLLWTYYTLERPPLWIVPAWPIATLAIDRLYRFARPVFFRLPAAVLDALYAAVFLSFSLIMLAYVAPTIGKPFTIYALLLCSLLILSPGNRRTALLMFLAGAGLGYFLELWGTTRACWTYYSLETPPLFAVLAHGMAAMAFWRAGRLLRKTIRHSVRRLKRADSARTQPESSTPPLRPDDGVAL